MAAAVGYYPRFRSYVPSTGLPNVAGTVQFFAAATSTPLPVYSDATLTVPLANPLTLDANGEALFYTGAGIAYKVTVKDSLGALIWTEDNIIFGGGSGTSVVGGGSEWVQFSGTPTFISATQFSVVGDQRATFDAKRRVKSTVTAGTAYSTVVSSSFGGGNTTVTVLNDLNSALDAGLSVVQTGILDPANPSVPLLSFFWRKNFLLNGAMQVSQRIGGPGGTVTYAAATGYTLDRWQGKSGAGSSAIYQQVGTVGLLDGFPFAIRMQRTAANAAVTLIQLAQSLETNDSSPLSNQLVVLSFYARAGGNYSPAGGLLNASVIYGSGTDQNVLAGYTGAATVINGNAALVNGWTRFQFVGQIPSLTPNEVGVVFSMTPVGVAGANDYCEITGVQLEVSNAATDFDHRPFSESLARCQRYYQKTFPYATIPAQNSGVLGGAATCFAKRAAAVADGIVFNYPVAMRTAPTLTSYNPSAANVQPRDTTAAADCSALAFLNNNSAGMQMSFLANAATAINNLLQVHITADAEL